jgi:hypothetical protein
MQLFQLEVIPHQGSFDGIVLGFPKFRKRLHPLRDFHQIRFLTTAQSQVIHLEPQALTAQRHYNTNQQY